MEFNIFTKEVEIEGKTYKLRPLSGRFLPKLYSILSKMDMSKKEGENSTEEMMKLLTEENINNLHFITLETFKKSYPEEKEEVLDEFVSQNLLKLMGAIIEVNIGSQSE